MKTTNLSTRHSRLPDSLRCFIGLLSTLAAAFCSIAAVANEEEEVFDLSPFTVSVSEDTGYYAQETLAGTRLRTSIRDLPGSLTIVTEEFLDDLGAMNLTEALSFTPSIDVVHGGNDQNIMGTQRRFGDGEDNRSIRGFGTSSNSRNFFATLGAMDRYNLGRLTISRGPNSILFGVGAPGGVVDASTKRPFLRRELRRADFRTDQHGTVRLELDVSQPIVQRRFAIRVNALREQRNGFRDDEARDQDRITLSALYSPSRRTSVFVTGELYDIKSNPVPMVWGFDMGILRWIAAGRPTVDFINQGRPWGHGQMTFVDADGNPVMKPDGSGPIESANDVDPTGSIFDRSAPTLTLMDGLGLANPVYNLRYEGRLRGNIIAGNTGGGVRPQTLDPFALYGIPRTANLFMGSRDDPSTIIHGYNYSGFIEHEFRPNLHLEVATHQAMHHRRRTTPGGRHQIWMDVNKYLPDGSENPGYLQPYGTGGTGSRERKTRARDYRSVLAYELDLRDVNRWLGRHSFAGLLQYSEYEDRRDNYDVVNLASVGWGGGFAPNSLGGRHQLDYRTYFVDGVVRRPFTAQNEVIGNLDIVNAQGTAPSSYAGAGDVPLNFQVRRVNAGVATYNETVSKQISWHGFWLRDRLVTMFGYRKDTQDIFQMPIERNVFDPDLPAHLPEHQKYFFASAFDVEKPIEPTITESGISRTYGVVLHTLSWLSLTYNRSANFQPVGQATRDIFGDPVRPSTGETEDYGIRFSFLNDRIAGSITRFETVENNRPRFDGIPRGSIFRPAENILNRMRSNYANEDFPYFSDYPPDFGPIDEDGAEGTRWFTDTVTRGWEMGIVVNPVPNWRISLSGSRNTTTNDGSLPRVTEWLMNDTAYIGFGTWRTYVDELRKVAGEDAQGNPVTPQPSSMFAGYDPDNQLDQLMASADARDINEWINEIEQGYRDQLALDGITTVRNGKYSFNMVTRYSFRPDSPLSNWAIGGNFQYRSAPTIGYDRIRDEDGNVTIFDVNRPFTGDDFYTFGALIRYDRSFDGFDLRVQLNVNNLFNQRKPLPVTLDIDTEGVMQAGNVPGQPAIIRYELRQPRVFRLTVGINF